MTYTSSQSTSDPSSSFQAPKRTEVGELPPPLSPTIIIEGSPTGSSWKGSSGSNDKISDDEDENDEEDSFSSIPAYIGVVTKRAPPTTSTTPASDTATNDMNSKKRGRPHSHLLWSGSGDKYSDVDYDLRTETTAASTSSASPPLGGTADSLTPVTTNTSSCWSKDEGDKESIAVCATRLLPPPPLWERHEDEEEEEEDDHVAPVRSAPTVPLAAAPPPPPPPPPTATTPTTATTSTSRRSSSAFVAASPKHPITTAAISPFLASSSSSSSPPRSPATPRSDVTDLRRLLQHVMTLSSTAPAVAEANDYDNDYDDEDDDDESIMESSHTSTLTANSSLASFWTLPGSSSSNTGSSMGGPEGNTTSTTTTVGPVLSSSTTSSSLLHPTWSVQSDTSPQQLQQQQQKQQQQEAPPLWEEEERVTMLTSKLYSRDSEMERQDRQQPRANAGGTNPQPRRLSFSSSMSSSSESYSTSSSSHSAAAVAATSYASLLEEEGNETSSSSSPTSYLASNVASSSSSSSTSSSSASRPSSLANSKSKMRSSAAAAATASGSSSASSYVPLKWQPVQSCDDDEEDGPDSNALLPPPPKPARGPSPLSFLSKSISSLVGRKNSKVSTAALAEPSSSASTSSSSSDSTTAKTPPRNTSSSSTPSSSTNWSAPITATETTLLPSLPPTPPSSSSSDSSSSSPKQSSTSTTATPNSAVTRRPRWKGGFVTPVAFESQAWWWDGNYSYEESLLVKKQSHRCSVVEWSGTHRPPTVVGLLGGAQDEVPRTGDVYRYPNGREYQGQWSHWLSLTFGDQVTPEGAGTLYVPNSCPLQDEVEMEADEEEELQDLVYGEARAAPGPPHDAGDIYDTWGRVYKGTFFLGKLHGRIHVYRAAPLSIHQDAGMTSPNDLLLYEAQYILGKCVRRESVTALGVGHYQSSSSGVLPMSNYRGVLNRLGGGVLPPPSPSLSPSPSPSGEAPSPQTVRFKNSNNAVDSWRRPGRLPGIAEETSSNSSSSSSHATSGASSINEKGEIQSPGRLEENQQDSDRSVMATVTPQFVQQQQQRTLENDEGDASWQRQEEFRQRIRSAFKEVWHDSSHDEDELSELESRRRPQGQRQFHGRRSSLGGVAEVLRTDHDSRSTRSWSPPRQRRSQQFRMENRARITVSEREDDETKKKMDFSSGLLDVIFNGSRRSTRSLSPPRRRPHRLDDDETETTVTTRDGNTTMDSESLSTDLMNLIGRSNLHEIGGEEEEKVAPSSLETFDSENLHQQGDLYSSLQREIRPLGLRHRYRSSSNDALMELRRRQRADRSSLNRLLTAISDPVLMSWEDDETNGVSGNTLAGKADTVRDGSSKRPRFWTLGDRLELTLPLDVDEERKVQENSDEEQLALQMKNLLSCATEWGKASKSQEGPAGAMRMAGPPQRPQRRLVSRQRESSCRSLLELLQDDNPSVIPGVSPGKGTTKAMADVLVNVMQEEEVEDHDEGDLEVEEEENNEDEEEQKEEEQDEEVANSLSFCAHKQGDEEQDQQTLEGETSLRLSDLGKGDKAQVGGDEWGHVAKQFSFLSLGSSIRTDDEGSRAEEKEGEETVVGESKLDDVNHEALGDSGSNEETSTQPVPHLEEMTWRYGEFTLALSEIGDDENQCRGEGGDSEASLVLSLQSGAKHRRGDDTGNLSIKSEPSISLSSLKRRFRSRPDEHGGHAAKKSSARWTSPGVVSQDLELPPNEVDRYDDDAMSALSTEGEEPHFLDHCDGVIPGPTPIFRTYSSSGAASSATQVIDNRTPQRTRVAAWNGGRSMELLETINASHSTVSHPENNSLLRHDDEEEHPLMASSSSFFYNSALLHGSMVFNNRDTIPFSTSLTQSLSNLDQLIPLAAGSSLHDMSRSFSGTSSILDPPSFDHTDRLTPVSAASIINRSSSSLNATNHQMPPPGSILQPYPPSPSSANGRNRAPQALMDRREDLFVVPTSTSRSSARREFGESIMSRLESMVDDSSISSSSTSSSRSRRKLIGRRRSFSDGEGTFSKATKSGANRRRTSSQEF